VGQGEKSNFKKENKFHHKKAHHEGEWNRGQDAPKREKPKHFQGSRFKPKGNFVKKRVPFKGSNPKGMPMGSPKGRVLITTKWGISPKIAPNLNRGMGARK
jgi:hypothetical protein